GAGPGNQQKCDCHCSRLYTALGRASCSVQNSRHIPGKHYDNFRDCDNVDIAGKRDGTAEMVV
ncbi:MAG: hypothetical protein GQ541_08390, partial [Desulfovibrionaceae bacterium]|nr:hypothetical protein [Desulfovibrionaceae bacterium]